MSTSSSPHATHVDGVEARNVAQEPAAADRVSPPLELSGRVVLLATDGSPSALAGAHLAQALAAQHHARIHVISVVDTRPAPMPLPLDMALALGDAAIGHTVHAKQEERLRQELASALGDSIDWPVRIALGTPAAEIVQEARRTDAALIIVGLRRHGRVDRAIHDETALNVMRHATCPVLGVTEETNALPARILVAMDFSHASMVATRAARAVAAENALLVLAYAARPSAFAEDEGESVIHELGVGAGFAGIADDLKKDGARFDHVVLHQAMEHSVAEDLLEYADTVGCDLLAAGSVRRGRVNRWLMGSVSTDLVRDGRRSVLIAPPESGP